VPPGGGAEGVDRGCDGVLGFVEPGIGIATDDSAGCGVDAVAMAGGVAPGAIDPVKGGVMFGDAEILRVCDSVGKLI